MTGDGFAYADADGVAHIGLGAEVQAVDYIHREVLAGRNIPMAEVHGIVRALAVTIRREQGVLLSLLEIRSLDEYTTSHACNVAMLSMALSDQMGLSDADTRAIGTAALLHDIGMLRIPTEVLTRPGAITPAERLLIETHTVEGARLLTARGLGNSLAATVAYEHHIWFNGAGGYPQLMYPRKPHFASRIVHVCDIYDALRSMRPYHEPWPRDEALALLKSFSGLQLDPQLTDAFLSMADSATEIRQPLGAQTA